MDVGCCDNRRLCVGRETPEAGAQMKKVDLNEGRLCTIAQRSNNSSKSVLAGATLARNGHTPCKCRTRSRGRPRPRPLRANRRNRTEGRELARNSGLRGAHRGSARIGSVRGRGRCCRRAWDLAEPAVPTPNEHLATALSRRDTHTNARVRRVPE